VTAVTIITIVDAAAIAAAEGSKSYTGGAYAPLFPFFLL